MAKVVGIDPGTKGALAMYDTDTKSLVGSIVDIPVWFQAVGKTQRRRIDLLALADVFDTFDLIGADLVVMEEVGVRPKEAAKSAFAFGYTVALIYASAFYTGLPIDTVQPAVWKMQLNVPGKSRADATAILHRADEMFPEHREQFRGPKGGKLVDRAEAAMIAKYGGDFLYLRHSVATDVETKLGYKYANTGA